MRRRIFRFTSCAAAALLGALAAAGPAGAEKLKEFVDGEVRYWSASDGQSVTHFATVVADDPACRRGISGIKTRYIFTSEFNPELVGSAEYDDVYSRRGKGWSITVPATRSVPTVYPVGSPNAGQSAGTYPIGRQSDTDLYVRLARTGRWALLKFNKSTDDRQVKFKHKEYLRRDGKKVTAVWKCTLAASDQNSYPDDPPPPPPTTPETFDRFGSQVAAEKSGKGGKGKGKGKKGKGKGKKGPKGPTQGAPPAPIAEGPDICEIAGCAPGLG